MSETRDQLIAILDAIRPIYHQRHLLFSRNGGFDREVSVQHAVALFNTIHSFEQIVFELANIPALESLIPDCETFISKMKTGNRDEFFKSVKELHTLLNGHLPQTPPPMPPSNASPINRIVIELLNDQVHVVLDKRDQLFDNNDPYDEAAFKEANDGLRFSRDVYKEQLRTNTVAADHVDVFDCQQSNTSISEAVGNNFVERIAAADTLLKSKIKPRLAHENLNPS